MPAAACVLVCWLDLHIDSWRVCSAESSRAQTHIEVLLLFMCVRVCDGDGKRQSVTARCECVCKQAIHFLRRAQSVRGAGDPAIINHTRC